MLHIGTDKVYRLIRADQLRNIKIGRLRPIADQQLAEFLVSLEGAASAHTPRDQDVVPPHTT